MRLQILNYKCFKNAEVVIDKPYTVLTGSGKSTLRDMFEILKHIGIGEMRVDNVLSWVSNTGFEFEISLKEHHYKYRLLTCICSGVSEESLDIDGVNIFSRDSFPLSNRMLMLPMYQHTDNRVNIFRSWLANMIILAPVPSMMSDGLVKNDEQLDLTGSNFVSYLNTFLNRYPKGYIHIEQYLSERYHNFREFWFKSESKDEKTLKVLFERELNFSLSSGEKMDFLIATLCAVEKYFDNMFCFWDDFGNDLINPVETITHLTSVFKDSSQLVIATKFTPLIEKGPLLRI